jgi:hypothetical protein
LLPKKIQNADYILIEQRKTSLEGYLNQVLALQDLPSAVLDFIDFNYHSRIQARRSIIDGISRAPEAFVRISNTDILIDEN